MPDDLVDENDEPSNDNQNLRNLREQAKQAKALQHELEAANARLAAMERESAFRSAGIDPADPKAKWLVKGYDGDLSADAIRAEAESAGLLNAPEPAQQNASPDEIAGFDRFSQAAAGGQAGQTPETWETGLSEQMSPHAIALHLAAQGRPVTGFGVLDPLEGANLRD